MSWSGLEGGGFAAGAAPPGDAGAGALARATTDGDTPSTASKPSTGGTSRRVTITSLSLLRRRGPQRNASPESTVLTWIKFASNQFV
jgi:hypothetical protein